MPKSWVWRGLFVLSSTVLVLSMVYQVGSGYIVAILLGLVSFWLRLEK
jgi:hypothetical protein